MPGYFPMGGLATDEVVDPLAVAGEFQEAARVAGAQTQMQWIEAAFGSVTHLARGAAFIASYMRTSAPTNSTDTSSADLPDDVAADANLWKVPYQSPFDLVGTGTTDGPLQVQYTTSYPEMVLILFSGQYIRRDLNAWSVTFNTGENRNIRCQLRLRVNSAELPGGPFAFALDGRPRGTGISEKAVPVCFGAIHFLPPGSHAIDVVGRQTALTGVDNTDDAKSEKTPYVDVAPSDGVCIGSRTLAVLRFRKGLPLTA